MISTLRLIKRLGRQGRKQDWLHIACYFLCAVVLVVFLVYFLLAYYLANDPRLVPYVFRHTRSIVLVTAHPDDETLFFSPSILYRRHDPSVARSLLVISSGDFNGIGQKRQTELHNSCAKLGISQDRCVVISHPDLQDNPKKWWNEQLIKDIITPYIEKWHAGLILTFDDGGISGHVNHRAVSAGVKNYVSTTKNAPPAFALQSTPLLRKYSSLLDLLPTALPFSWRITKALLMSAPRESESQDVVSSGLRRERALLVSSWGTYRESRAAFSQHESQYSWDRVLYLIVSRYMWFNTLETLEVPGGSHYGMAKYM